MPEPGTAVAALREALHPVTARPMDIGAWMQLVIASVIELDDRLTNLTTAPPDDLTDAEADDDTDEGNPE